MLILGVPKFMGNNLRVGKIAIKKTFFIALWGRNEKYRRQNRKLGNENIFVYIILE